MKRYTLPAEFTGDSMERDVFKPHAYSFNDKFVEVDVTPEQLETLKRDALRTIANAQAVLDAINRH